jgi:hypothetical protein
MVGVAVASSGGPEHAEARAAHAPKNFVGRKGTHFVLDGKPFRFVGLDFFQGALNHGISSCGPAGNTPELLASSAAAWQGRVTVLRVWFFQRFVTFNGHRDWTPFDRLIRFATENHIRLIPVLADQWSYCEPPFKTASWYRGGYVHRALPDESVPYRRFVKEVVKRYHNSPAIMMWELVNEPEISWAPNRPVNDPRAFHILYRFTRNVSRLIKSIDPYHLVSLGTRGIFPIRGKAGLSTRDYARIDALRTIDACSYHDYSAPDVTLPHKAVAAVGACTADHKPTYAGEVGIDARVVSDPVQRAADLGAKMLGQLNGGASGFLVWNWWPAKVYGPYQVTPGDPALEVLSNALLG